MFKLATSSRTALLIIIGGFSVVFIANGALVYYAFHSWTGLESDQYYVRGLAYNDDIEGARKQQALGWKVVFKEKFDGPKSGVISVGLSDRDGRPLSGLRAKVFAVRPTQDGFDREFLLKDKNDGQYRATFSLPLKGVWDLRVVARQGKNVFQHVERIVTP